jgi:excisionase family DNA binding protein
MRTTARVFPVTDGLDALFEGRDPTLSAPEVAEMLGMTKQGVYHWLRDGVIPGYKVGTTWFILRDELKETLRKGANAPRLRGTKSQEDDKEG